MKKLVIFSVLCFWCFCLTACDPGHFRFEYEDLSDSVIGIELIDYNNSEQKHFLSWVPDHSSKLRSFNMENMTIIETLDAELFPGFLEQLADVSFLDKYYAFDSPKGTGIRLIYANGDFEVLSCNGKSYVGYVGRYNESGDVINFIGCFTDYYDFESLVNDFFETSLINAE